MAREVDVHGQRVAGGVAQRGRYGDFLARVGDQTGAGRLLQGDVHGRGSDSGAGQRPGLAVVSVRRREGPVHYAASADFFCNLRHSTVAG